ncbi:MAG: YggS family pyridoxal phosphate-dependent enzyme [Planctomycetales bacterium]
MSLPALAANLGCLRDRIAAACARVDRPASSVRLVAVTKSAALEQVRQLTELGVWDLGESRPQQLLERAAQLPAGVRWHLIGHLQRNKARRILPLADCIHSVDSFRLLDALERLAAELGAAPRVLLQINVSGESSKHGFDPADLERDWDSVRACRRVRIAGLMTMAPHADAPERSRPVFRALRELRDRLASISGGALPLVELSMGMTGDFEPAIEEGATIVRIGSALFDQ